MAARLGSVAAITLAALLLITPLAACVPRGTRGSLAPTLELRDVGGARVAFQNGIPVPTFDPQPRPRIPLIGRWRVDRERFRSDLSLTARPQALEAILAEAEGREQPDYDDGDWEQLTVPGTLNPAPQREIGAWYRRTFYVPDAWTGGVATLKFGAVNYIADVWLNGQHLGYHEGGYTPFAFDVSPFLRAGEINTLALRVDNPAWGTRNDIVPWGLADWWNYGGITQPVWIELTPPLHVVRADAVPHLDGLDVVVTLRRAEAVVGDEPSPSPSPSLTPEETVASETPDPDGTGASASALASASAEETEPPPEEPVVRVEILSATVGPDNLDDPLASSLADLDHGPLVTDELELPDLEPGGVATLNTGFLIGDPDRWSPAHPALYVLHVDVEGAPEAEEPVAGDDLWTTFGLRHVTVDTAQARILLNGTPETFTGVGLHDEVLTPDPDGELELLSAHRVHDVEPLLEALNRARQVDAELIRTGHTPANPLLLMLADRLGFAVWEEIPLYHYTPLTYGIAMERGIPQQMLREMALRDMNRPSVLFHGLSNESTGTEERLEALEELHRIDREIDGTRLTGQAAYGSLPNDPTQWPLDVAGYTFYYGVFYGRDAADDTARALEEIHDMYPDKPVMALEFGRWADDPGGPEAQRRIFELTFRELQARSAEHGGYVGGMVWWTLQDFATMAPNIVVEHFGLFDAFGQPRPAAAAADRLFAAVAGEGGEQEITSEAGRVRVAREPQPDLRLVGYLAFALAFSLATLGAGLALLVHRGGRATAAPLRSRRR
ncbi:MAG TPA: glycoside hydrolase family 2 TIM barrel-domain containing protein [candidate division Zixibacteria bacterium]|nr:glycoside hydrolase family 2 TIM barrel-domain containing protein [candidate division Zixibacteria bacterium]